MQPFEWALTRCFPKWGDQWQWQWSLLRNTLLHCSTPSLHHPCVLLFAPLEITHKEAFALNSNFSHVWMWELDHKESWALKNWCFWIVVLEKTLESPLDCKEIQSVHPNGDHSWISIGRTDGEAGTPIFRPVDSKNWLIGKDPDAGRDWGQEEKGTTED